MSSEFVSISWLVNCVHVTLIRKVSVVCLARYNIQEHVMHACRVCRVRFSFWQSGGSFGAGESSILISMEQLWNAMPCLALATARDRSNRMAWPKLWNAKILTNMHDGRVITARDRGFGGCFIWMSSMGAAVREAFRVVFSCWLLRASLLIARSEYQMVESSIGWVLCCSNAMAKGHALRQHIPEASGAVCCSRF